MGKRKKSVQCRPLEYTQKVNNNFPGWLDSMKIEDDPLVVTDITGMLGTAPAAVRAVTKVNVSIWQQAVCVNSWRQNKQIFSFSGELYDDLADGEDFTVPAEILKTLPYKAVYVEVPDRKIEFFAYWQYPSAISMDNAPELMINWWTGEQYRPLTVKIIDGKTIRECVEATDAETNQSAHLVGKDIEQVCTIETVPIITRAIQLLLYLCSQGADVQESPRTKKTYKKTARIRDKFSEVRQQEIGVRYREWKRSSIRGSATYAEKSSAETGRTVIPHMRRGHWHHYWTGKKESKKLVLKWVPPVFVNKSLASAETAPTINTISKPEI